MVEQDDDAWQRVTLTEEESHGAWIWSGRVSSATSPGIYREPTPETSRAYYYLDGESVTREEHE